MFDKILVLAPHTDDGELGCGGSIARFIDEGKTVTYVAFSSPLLELQNELKQAAKILGVQESIIHPFEFRMFYRDRQRILDYIIELRESIKPDLVLLPSLDDLHQDHQIIVQEGIRAFKRTTIISYELPWNNITFRTEVFIPFTKKHLDKKLKALECYKTQESRAYLDKHFIKCWAVMRGKQIDHDYAECFQIVRWVI